jgi:type III secretory pathway component EscU
MNPTINTSFLPDREREAEEKRLREELRQEWLRKQEEIKSKFKLNLYLYLYSLGMIFIEKIIYILYFYR